MTGRCETCRWWIDIELDDATGRQWGNCVLTISMPDRKPAYPQTIAWCEPGTSGSRLLTLGGFGCVQYEAAE